MNRRFKWILFIICFLILFISLFGITLHLFLSFWKMYRGIYYKDSLYYVPIFVISMTLSFFFTISCFKGIIIMLLNEEDDTTHSLQHEIVVVQSDQSLDQGSEKQNDPTI